MAEKLTVLIPTTNELNNIRDCLESVKWADEIFVVVDDRCNDGTEEICREYTDRVVHHEYVDSASQKNWAIPQAGHPWILLVDADERVTPELKEQVQQVLRNGPDCDGYEVRRQTYFFGKLIQHCGWDKEYVLRLFRKDTGRYQNRRVHARVLVPGKVGRIDASLLHHTYRDFNDYRKIFDRYTTLAAEDLLCDGKRATWYNLALRPAARFLKMYILRLGFLDGFHGLILCSLAAISVFTKYAKLWDMQRRSLDQETDSSYSSKGA